MLAGAAAVVSVNWGTYIWAVNHGHVVETSLGYYINPILSILVGVIFLRERLAPLQWVSVGLAAAAVVVLTIDYGRLPWIALVLAVSFATYGVIKKQVNGGAVETLTVESAVLTPVALGYLIFLQTRGHVDVRPSRLVAQPAAGGHRTRHRGAAAVLRRRRHPAAAEHPRTVAVPRPDPAVPARRALLRRDHVRGAMDRLRPGLARAGDPDRVRSPPARPSAAAAADRPSRETPVGGG